MFKYLERWKEDWQNEYGQGLDFVDDDSWEALRARIRVIHGGIGSDGFTGQRKQDGTPDKRTRQGKAWTDAEPEPEPEAELEAESESEGVYATLLPNCGALHGILQGLHEEVREDRKLPDGQRHWDASRPELIKPPTVQANPYRDWAGSTTTPE